jgi:hypothetical protein
MNADKKHIDFEKRVTKTTKNGTKSTKERRTDRSAL